MSIVEEKERRKDRTQGLVRGEEEGGAREGDVGPVPKKAMR